MPLVVYIEDSGAQYDVEASDGDSVMRGALDNGINGIVGECGGGLACATCHCYVDEAWIDRLDPPSQMEIEMLDMAASELKQGSRLSCQITMTGALDGLVVRLPKRQF